MHCPDRQPARSTGFTLLELIVSVAIFAVVGALAVGGMHSVLTADQVTRERSDRMAELQVMLALLERDIRHAVALAPRDAFGDRQPPLHYSPHTQPRALHLVRGGLGGDQRLARVEWRISDEGLERYSSPVIDGAQEESRPADERPNTRRFLAAPHDGRDDWRARPAQREGMARRIEFAFVQEPGSDPRDDWPPVGESGSRLPAQVIFAFEDRELGRIERRIPVSRQR